MSTKNPRISSRSETRLTHLIWRRTQSMDLDQEVAACLTFELMVHILRKPSNGCKTATAHDHDENLDERRLERRICCKQCNYESSFEEEEQSAATESVSEFWRYGVLGEKEAWEFHTSELFRVIPMTLSLSPTRSSRTSRTSGISKFGQSYRSSRSRVLWHRIIEQRLFVSSSRSE